MNEIVIAVIAGLLALIFWGLPDVFAKKAIDRVGHYTSLLYTILFATIFYIPYFLFESTLPALDWSILVVIPFAMMDLAGGLFLYKAYSVGKLSIIGPIASSYAVVTIILSAIFFDEEFSNLKIIALVVVVVGLFFTVFDVRQLKDDIRGGSVTKGAGYALICCILYGLFVPFWDEVMNKEGWLFLSLIEKIFLVFGLVILMLIKKEQGIIFKY